MFEAAPVKSIAPCSLGAWMNGLNDTDRTNLQAWLDAEWVTHADLIRQIAGEAKVAFGKETISNHRAGRCRCSRK